MAVTIYHEQDVDPRIIQGQQGGRHRLREPGARPCAQPAWTRACDVRVGLREGSRVAGQKAEEAGLKVTTIDEAAEEADFVMIARPRRDSRRRCTSSTSPRT